MRDALVEELERRRVAAKISKWELARRMGVSRHTVARKLSGETELTVSEGVSMCRALGTTLQVVLDLVGAPTRA